MQIKLQKEALFRYFKRFQADVLSVYECCIVLKLQLITNYKTFSSYMLAKWINNL